MKEKTLTETQSERKNSLDNWIPRIGVNSLKPTYQSVMSDTLWAYNSHGKCSTALPTVQSVDETDLQQV